MRAYKSRRYSGVRNFPFLRQTALALLACFFFTQNPALASSFNPEPVSRPGTQGSHPSVVQNTFSFLANPGLPPELGTLEQHGPDAATAKGIVILLRDAHAIPQAQEKLSEIIRRFAGAGVRQIGLEGASGTLDSVFFRSFPDPELLAGMLDQFVESGGLSGAAAACADSRVQAECFGMENADAYRLAVNAYLAAVPARDAFYKRLEQTGQELGDQQQAAYGSALFEFAAAARGFEQHETGMETVLRVAEKILGIEAFRDSLAVYPSLGAAALALLENEKDSESFGAEVRKIALGLEPRLSAVDRQTLTGKLQMLDTESLGVVEMASWLKSFSGRLGLSLELSEKLAAASVRYENLSRIEGVSFSREWRAWMRAVRTRLAVTESEKILEALEIRFERLKRLLSLSLEGGEWEVMAGADNAGYSRKAIPESLRPLYEAVLDFESRLMASGSPFRLFYEASRIREQVFADSLAARLRMSSSPAILAVTGGYHTEALTQELIRQDIAVAVVTPFFDRIPDEDVYARVMSGAISWRNDFESRRGRLALNRSFFHAAARALAANPESRFYARSWREGIIRALAAGRRLSGAAYYTGLLDRSLETPVDTAAWTSRVESFLQGLRDLKIANRLNPESVMALTRGSLAMPWTGVLPLQLDSTVPDSWAGGEAEKGWEKAVDGVLKLERRHTPLDGAGLPAGFPGRRNEMRHREWVTLEDNEKNHLGLVSSGILFTELFFRLAHEGLKLQDETGGAEIRLEPHGQFLTYQEHALAAPKPILGYNVRVTMMRAPGKQAGDLAFQQMLKVEPVAERDLGYARSQPDFYAAIHDDEYPVLMELDLGERQEQLHNFNAVFFGGFRADGKFLKLEILHKPQGRDDLEPLPVQGLVFSPQKMSRLILPETSLDLTPERSEMENNLSHADKRNIVLRASYVDDPRKQRAELRSVPLAPVQEDAAGIRQRMIRRVIEQTDLQRSSGQLTEEASAKAERLMVVLPKLEELGQRFARAYGMMAEEYGLCPGRVQVIWTGGRLRGDPVKAKSDLDLIFAVDNPRQGLSSLNSRPFGSVSQFYSELGRKLGAVIDDMELPLDLVNGWGYRNGNGGLTLDILNTAAPIRENAPVYDDKEIRLLLASFDPSSKEDDAGSAAAIFKEVEPGTPRTELRSLDAVREAWRHNIGRVLGAVHAEDIVSLELNRALVPVLLAEAQKLHETDRRTPILSVGEGNMYTARLLRTQLDHADGYSLSMIEPSVRDRDFQNSRLAAQFPDLRHLSKPVEEIEASDFSLPPRLIYTSMSFEYTNREKHLEVLKRIAAPGARFVWVFHDDHSEIAAARRFQFREFKLSMKALQLLRAFVRKEIRKAAFEAQLEDVLRGMSEELRDSYRFYKGQILARMSPYAGPELFADIDYKMRHTAELYLNYVAQYAPFETRGDLSLKEWVPQSRLPERDRGEIEALYGQIFGSAGEIRDYFQKQGFVVESVVPHALRGKTGFYIAVMSLAEQRPAPRNELRSSSREAFRLTPGEEYKVDPGETMRFYHPGVFSIFAWRPGALDEDGELVLDEPYEFYHFLRLTDSRGLVQFEEDGLAVEENRFGPWRGSEDFDLQVLPDQSLVITNNRETPVVVYGSPFSDRGELRAPAQRMPTYETSAARLVQELQNRSQTDLYKMDVLPGFPEGVTINIYPGDASLKMRLERADLEAHLDRIQVPFGTLGQVRVSLIVVDEAPGVLIENLQPSHAYRAVRSASPHLLTAYTGWQDDAVEMILKASRAAGLRTVFAKSPQFAELQNPEMGHGRARRYYQLPFRAKFREQRTLFRNAFYSWEELDQIAAREREAYGRERNYGGGWADLWRFDHNVWLPPRGSRADPLPKKKFAAVYDVMKTRVIKTPLVEAGILGQISGKRVFLKDESRQQGGSFKYRGVYFEVYAALTRLLHRPDARDTLRSGVKIVTQSTGNHGVATIGAVTQVVQELAARYETMDPEFAALIRTVEPVIFTLRQLPPVKLRLMQEALDEYRALTGSTRGDIRNQYDSYEDALQARQQYLAEHSDEAFYMEHGGEDIMLGHGSAGIEIADQLKEAGIRENQKVVLILPVGAGGPLGIAAALKHYRKNTQVVMVQSDRWDAFVRTLQNGKMEKNPKVVPPTDTVNYQGRPFDVVFPDGIAVDGAEPFAVEIARAYLDAAVSVDEKRAYDGSGVLLFKDLLDAGVSQTEARVGGTTALTAEALLSLRSRVRAIRDADAVVLFGTEGNVEAVVNDHLRSLIPQAESLRRKYQNLTHSELRTARENDSLEEWLGPALRTRMQTDFSNPEDARVQAARKDLLAWLKEHPHLEWQAGDYGSEKDGALKAVIRADDLGRIQVAPQPVWNKKHPTLAAKLQRNDKSPYPDAGSFWQHSLDWAWNEKGIAVSVGETQTGRGFGQFTRGQREQIGRGRTAFLKKLIEWADSRGVLVFASSPEVFQTYYPAMRKFPHTVRENYEEPYDSSLWELRELPLVPTALLHHHKESFSWWVYKGNAELLARASRPKSELRTAAETPVSADQVLHEEAGYLLEHLAPGLESGKKDALAHQLVSVTDLSVLADQQSGRLPDLLIGHLFRAGFGLAIGGWLAYAGAILGGLMYLTGLALQRTGVPVDASRLFWGGPLLMLPVLVWLSGFYVPRTLLKGYSSFRGAAILTAEYSIEDVRIRQPALIALLHHEWTHQLALWGIIPDFVPAGAVEALRRYELENQGFGEIQRQPKAGLGLYFLQRAISGSLWRGPGFKRQLSRSFKEGYNTVREARADDLKGKLSAFMEHRLSRLLRGRLGDHRGLSLLHWPLALISRGSLPENYMRAARIGGAAAALRDIDETAAWQFVRNPSLDNLKGRPELRIAIRAPDDEPEDLIRLLEKAILGAGGKDNPDAVLIRWTAEHGAYVDRKFVQGHRRDLLAAIRRLAEAFENYFGSPFDDQVTLISMAGLPDYHIEQNHAAALMAVGVVLGLWEIFPNYDFGQTVPEVAYGAGLVPLIHSIDTKTLRSEIRLTDTGRSLLGKFELEMASSLPGVTALRALEKVRELLTASGILLGQVAAGERAGPWRSEFMQSFDAAQVLLSGLIEAPESVSAYEDEIRDQAQRLVLSLEELGRRFLAMPFTQGRKVRSELRLPPDTSVDPAAAETLVAKLQAPLPEGWREQKQASFEKYWAMLDFLHRHGILQGNIFYPAMGHDIFPGYFGRVVGLNENPNAFTGDGSKGYRYNFLMNTILRRDYQWPGMEKNPALESWMRDVFHVDSYTKPLKDRFPEGVDVLFLKGFGLWAYYDRGWLGDKQIKRRVVQPLLREMDERFVKPGGYVILGSARDHDLADYLVRELGYEDVFASGSPDWQKVGRELAAERDVDGKDPYDKLNGYDGGLQIILGHVGMRVLRKPAERAPRPRREWDLRHHTASLYGAWLRVRSRVLAYQRATGVKPPVSAALKRDLARLFREYEVYQLVYGGAQLYSSDKLGAAGKLAFHQLITFQYAPLDPESKLKSIAPKYWEAFDRLVTAAWWERKGGLGVYPATRPGIHLAEWKGGDPRRADARTLSVLLRHGGRYLIQVPEDLDREDEHQRINFPVSLRVPSLIAGTAGTGEADAQIRTNLSMLLGKLYGIQADPQWLAAQDWKKALAQPETPLIYDITGEELNKLSGSINTWHRSALWSLAPAQLRQMARRDPQILSRELTAFGQQETGSRVRAELRAAEEEFQQWLNGTDEGRVPRGSVAAAEFNGLAGTGWAPPLKFWYEPLSAALKAIFAFRPEHEQHAIIGRVTAAYYDTPQHLFLKTDKGESYLDVPLEGGPRYRYQIPSLVAFMMAALDLKAHEKLLFAGAGSGWFPAWAALLAGQVDAVESDPELVREGREKVRLALRDHSVTYYENNPAEGLPDNGPYPAILAPLDLKEKPEALLRQLSPEGGRLMATVNGKLMYYVRHGETLQEQDLFAASGANLEEMVGRRTAHFIKYFDVPEALSKPYGGEGQVTRSFDFLDKFHHRRISRAIDRRLAAGEDLKILFIGIGRGNSAMDLLHRFDSKMQGRIELHSINRERAEDFLHTPVTYAAQKGVKHLILPRDARRYLDHIRSHYHAVDIQDPAEFPLPDQKFDLIILGSAVMEYMTSDRVRLLEKFKSALNPNGEFFADMDYSFQVRDARGAKVDPVKFFTELSPQYHAYYGVLGKHPIPGEYFSLHVVNSNPQDLTIPLALDPAAHDYYRYLQIAGTGVMRSPSLSPRLSGIVRYLADRHIRMRLAWPHDWPELKEIELVSESHDLDYGELLRVFGEALTRYELKEKRRVRFADTEIASALAAGVLRAEMRAQEQRPVDELGSLKKEVYRSFTKPAVIRWQYPWRDEKGRLREVIAAEAEIEYDAFFEQLVVQPAGAFAQRFAEELSILDKMAAQVDIAPRKSIFQMDFQSGLVRGEKTLVIDEIQFSRGFKHIRAGQVKGRMSRTQFRQLLQRSVEPAVLEVVRRAQELGFTRVLASTPERIRERYRSMYREASLDKFSGNWSEAYSYPFDGGSWNRVTEDFDRDSDVPFWAYDAQAAAAKLRDSGAQSPAVEGGSPRAELRTRDPDRLLPDVLKELGIRAEDYKVLVYPASGNSDGSLMASLKYKVFPGLEEFHLDSASYDPQYGGAQAGPLVKADLLRNLQRENAAEGVQVEIYHEDYYEVNFRIRDTQAPRIWIDKWPGFNAAMRSDPRFYLGSLRRGIVRPGDLILTVGFAGTQNEAVWSSHTLARRTLLPGDNRNYWDVTLVTQADVDAALAAPESLFRPELRVEEEPAPRALKELGASVYLLDDETAGRLRLLVPQDGTPVMVVRSSDAGVEAVRDILKKSGYASGADVLKGPVSVFLQESRLRAAHAGESNAQLMQAALAVSSASLSDSRARFFYSVLSRIFYGPQVQLELHERFDPSRLLALLHQSLLLTAPFLMLSASVTEAGFAAVLEGNRDQDLKGLVPRIEEVFVQLRDRWLQETEPKVSGGRENAVEGPRAEMRADIAVRSLVQTAARLVVSLAFGRHPGERLAREVVHHGTESPEAFESVVRRGAQNPALARASRNRELISLMRLEQHLRRRHPDFDGTAEALAVSSREGLRENVSDLSAKAFRDFHFALAYRMPETESGRRRLLDLVRTLEGLVRGNPGRVKADLRILIPAHARSRQTLRRFLSELEATGVARALEAGTQEGQHQLQRFLETHPQALVVDNSEETRLQGMELRLVRSRVDMEAALPVAVFLSRLTADALKRQMDDEFLSSLASHLPGVLEMKGGRLVITEAALELAYQFNLRQLIQSAA